MSSTRLTGERAICKHHLSPAGCALGPGICKFKHLENGQIPHEEKKLFDINTAGATTSAGEGVAQNASNTSAAPEFVRWVWRENASSVSSAPESWRPFSPELESQLENEYQLWRMTEARAVARSASTSAATRMQPATSVSTSSPYDCTPPSSQVKPSTQATCVLRGAHEVNFETMSMGNKSDGGSRRPVQRLLCVGEARWYLFNDKTGGETQLLDRRLSQMLEYDFVTGIRSFITIQVGGYVRRFNLDTMTAALEETQEVVQLVRQPVMLKYAGPAANPYNHPLLDERAIFETAQLDPLLAVSDGTGIGNRAHRGLLPICNPATMSIELVGQPPRTQCTRSACNLLKCPTSHVWMFKHNCPFGRAGECDIARQAGTQRASLHDSLFTHSGNPMGIIPPEMERWRAQRSIPAAYRKNWFSFEKPRLATAGARGASRVGASPNAGGSGSPPRDADVSSGSFTSQTFTPSATYDLTSSHSGRASDRHKQQSEALARLVLEQQQQQQQSSGPAAPGSALSITVPTSKVTLPAALQAKLDAHNEEARLTASKRSLSEVGFHNVVLGSSEGKLVQRWFEEPVAMESGAGGIKEIISRFPRIQRIQGTEQYTRYLRGRNELQRELFQVYGPQVLDNSDTVLFRLINATGIYDMLTQSSGGMEWFRSPQRAIDHSSVAAPGTRSTGRGDGEELMFLVAVAFWGTSVEVDHQTDSSRWNAVLPPLDDNVHPNASSDTPTQTVLGSRARKTMTPKVTSPTTSDPTQTHPLPVVTFGSPVASGAVPTPVEAPLAPPTPVLQEDGNPSGVAGPLQVVLAQATTDSQRDCVVLYSPNQWCPMYLVTLKEKD